MITYIADILGLNRKPKSLVSSDSNGKKFVIRHSTFPIPHSALTLIEMLIGMAITLVMMAAVVNLFANIGAGVRVRRAGMEMNGQLRLARAQLYKDLSGATCEARPKLPSDDHSDGYIEIIEGIYSDKNPSLLLDGVNPPTAANPELNFATSLIPSSNATLPAGNVTDGGGLGDYDDILALTVRSPAQPFVGRRLILRPGGVSTNPEDWIFETIQSDLAEIIWFAVENPIDGTLGEPGMRTIYRRVLLIAPWVGEIDLTAIPTSGGTAIINNNANRFYQRFDISARYDSVSNTWKPNTLSDLCKRENRFAHFVNNAAPDKGFPHEMQIANIRTGGPLFDSSPLHPFGDPWFIPDENYDDPDRAGDDVMLNNVLGFDLRVFDPKAPQYLNAGVVLEPSDFGWDEALTLGLPIVGVGAFVDLSYADETAQLQSPPPGVLPTATSQFSYQPSFWLGEQLRSLPEVRAVYDTWSYQYENDGIDSENNGVIDQGTNGLDDDGINGTDDIGERETSPPYNVPLRGIQAKIRVYEPDTRLIREATVTRNLVPE